MIDFLGQQSSNGDLVTNIATTVSAVVLALGGREGIAAVQRRRSNGNSYNKPLCDERHAHIEKNMEVLFTKLDKQDEKLNQIHEAVLKK